MKRVYMVLFFLFFTVWIPAEKVAIFPELTRPQEFKIDKSQIYIGDGTYVYIYSLEDFKLKKKFGGEGEGPMEFKPYPYGYQLRFNVHYDYINVNSLGKISIFTKEGEFKKEITSFQPNRYNYEPLGKNFAERGIVNEGGKNYWTLNIHDPKLNKIKEVYRNISDIQPGVYKIFTASFEYCSYDNKLFVMAGEDFEIEVFDTNGNHLYSIKQDYKRVKVSDADKKENLHYFKTTRDPVVYERIRKMIRFPKYYPALFFFIFNDDKMYVHTYKGKDGKVEFYIFDLKGKLLKQRFLPLVKRFTTAYCPYTFKNDNLYQLVENDKTEEWELHIIPIE